jgi:hypothetical protein
MYYFPRSLLETTPPPAPPPPAPRPRAQLLGGGEGGFEGAAALWGVSRGQGKVSPVPAAGSRQAVRGWPAGVWLSPAAAARRPGRGAAVTQGAGSAGMRARGQACGSPATSRVCSRRLSRLETP